MQEDAPAPEAPEEAAAAAPAETVAAAPEEAPAAAPAAAAAAPAARSRGPPKRPLSELEVGAEIEGTVKGTTSYGAFVDIGFATDGLLHISDLAAGFVKEVSEVVNSGDKVTVTVKAVNREKNQVSLTMIKAGDQAAAAAASPSRSQKPKVDLSKYEGMDSQIKMKGVISSIASYGCFVNLEDGLDGLVHISEISDERIETVESKVSVGQEVEVRVLSVDAGKRRVSLSMKDWVEGEEPVNMKAVMAEVDEGQPVFKSQLEIALARAEAKLAASA